MTGKYLIDTNVLIEGVKDADDWDQQLRRRARDLLVPSVAGGEFLQGAINQADLATLEGYLRPFLIFWVPEEVQQKALDLVTEYRLSHNLHYFDALIAAAALLFGFTLVTKNLKHFSFIPDLKVQNHF